jgi:AcrR family transcriptional regulator
MKPKKVSKHKIIAATAKIIADKGLDKITVDDIAQEADVAKGSIYFHFESKDKLLVDAVKTIARQRITKIRNALKGISSPTKKLKKLFSANNQMLKTDPDSFLMNYALLLSSHNKLKKRVAAQYLQDYIYLVEEILEEGIRKREFKDIDAASVAASLVLSNDMTGIINFPDSKIPTPQKLTSQLFKLIKNSDE